MPESTWIFGNGETLAGYLRIDDFRRLLSTRIAVPPDHLAVLIRDGQVVASYPGAHFELGGIWNRLKELVGGRHALRLLVADMKPFQVAADYRGLSRDRVEVAAEVTLEMQLDPDRPANIIGLVADNVSLAKADLYPRFQPHIDERVMSAALAGHDATELRGNSGLQDQIQADIMREIERLAGDLGLLVRGVSVSWAQNAEETQAIEQRRQTRDAEMREFEMQRRRRDLEMEQDATVWQLRADAELDAVKAASVNEMQKLLLRNELELTDARATGDRLRERKQLEHQLELARIQRVDAQKAALEMAVSDLERSRIEIDIRRLDLEFEQVQRRTRLETERLEAEQAMALARRSKEDDLDLAGRARDDQIDGLARLQELELQKNRELHDQHKDDFLTQHSAGMEQRRLDKEHELEKLRVQATMDPDQMLAATAGLSPEVAAVFAERARHAGVAAADKEALLREMVAMAKDQSLTNAAQAQHMFDRATEHLARVGSAAATGSAPAAPAGAGSSGDAAAGPAAPPATSAAGAECPACHQPVPLTDRFCKFCGAQLRS